MLRKMKSLLGKTVVAGVAFVAVLTVAKAANFTDTTTHRYKDAIDYIAEKGIVSGYSDNTFKPDEVINRAEFLKIVLGGAGYGVGEDLNSCFSDVEAQWFAPYVCTAKTLGAISGYEDNSFRPSQQVNFVEALKILEGAFGEEVSASEVWYQAYVEKAAEKNIIPLDVTSFSQTITRGQMADMMVRYLTDAEGTQEKYLLSAFGEEGLRKVTYAVLAGEAGENAEQRAEMRDSQGETDEAGTQRPSQQGGGQDGEVREIPAEALEVCEDLEEGDSCVLTLEEDEVLGVCQLTEDDLVCVPEGMPQGGKGGGGQGGDRPE